MRILEGRLPDDLPNVLLILPSDRSSMGFGLGLAKAFNEHANVFLSLINHRRLGHVIHRLPGRMKAGNRRLPVPVLRFIGGLVNPLHNTDFSREAPQAIDLLFVSDPVVCRFDLRPFRNAATVYWSHDAIYSSSYNTQILSTNLSRFDVVFCAHRSDVQRFEDLGLSAFHLPFAYDPDVMRPMRLSAKYDLAFIGTPTKERLKVLRKISEHRPDLRLFVGQRWQHDMARINNQSRMVLNISRAGEINWRVFEVLGCKSLLVTSESKEIGALFRDGKHLVMYEDGKDLSAKVENLLTMPEVRKRIAAQGFEEVSSKHTFHHRAQYILRAAGIQ